MANEGTENRPVLTNESFNQALELKKSFNAAVPLVQTIAQAQATGAAVAANTVQPSNQSSSNE